jgi:hypothetical protein
MYNYSAGIKGIQSLNRRILEIILLKKQSEPLQKKSPHIAMEAFSLFVCFVI